MSSAIFLPLDRLPHRTLHAFQSNCMMSTLTSCQLNSIKTHARQIGPVVAHSHTIFKLQQSARCPCLMRQAQSHHVHGQSCVSNDQVWIVCRALNSSVSTTRARPFDILYNLSLHAELLFSPARDPSQVISNCLPPNHPTNSSSIHVHSSIGRLMEDITQT